MVVPAYKLKLGMVGHSSSFPNDQTLSELGITHNCEIHAHIMSPLHFSDDLPLGHIFQIVCDCSLELSYLDYYHEPQSETIPEGSTIIGRLQEGIHSFNDQLFIKIEPLLVSAYEQDTNSYYPLYEERKENAEIDIPVESILSIQDLSAMGALERYHHSPESLPFFGKKRFA